MQQSIEHKGTKWVQKYVSDYAKTIGVPNKLHIDYVCSVCCTYPELAPNERGTKKTSGFSDEECLKVWVDRFYHAYGERISSHASKTPGTIPDQAVNIIIQAGLSKIKSAQMKDVVFAHRLCMSAENILGLLLEEFLFEKLSAHGWAMAWGETVKHVDFCRKDGFLLQVKNRSNSENSSSSKVRDGKPIERWFRVNATNGRYQWEKLSTIVGSGISDLTEECFQEFIRKTLKSNPNALAIEPENPWIKFRK